jgi:hypothetical protein
MTGRVSAEWVCGCNPVFLHVIGVAGRTCRLTFTVSPRSRLPQERRDGPGRRLGAARPRGIEALQRSAGNQAVGAILARFRSEEHARLPNRQAVLEIEELGTLELESVSMDEKSKSISLTLKGTAKTAELLAAQRNGRTFAQGRLMVGGMTFELRGIAVASVQVSGDMVSVELSLEGFNQAKEPAEEEPADRGWNFDLPPIG